MELFIRSQLKHSKAKNSVRSIALVAMLLAILVIQEQFLIFLPNVQLTVILIIVYAQFLLDKELYPLVVGYVLLDNLLMGSLNLMYTPAMFFSWLLLAFVAKKLKDKPDYTKFILAVVFAFVYGWSFIPATAILQNFTRWNQVFTYLKFDLPFEITMAVNNIFVFLVLYLPLTDLFRQLYRETEELLP